MMTEDTADFTRAIESFNELSDEQKTSMRREARRTAESFSLDRCVDKLVEVYESAIEENGIDHGQEEHQKLDQVLQLLARQWELWSTRAEAAAQTISQKFSHSKEKRNGQST
jgi:hypothetical protein